MAYFTDRQAQEEFNRYAGNVSEDDISGILDKEEDIFNKIHGPLEKLAGQIKLFFSLIKDYAMGNYKEIPWTTIAAVVGSLLYVFCPIDLIPDFIPVVGLMDDAAVVMICLKGIGQDLKKYELWKKEHSFEYEVVNDAG